MARRFRSRSSCFSRRLLQHLRPVAVVVTGNEVPEASRRDDLRGRNRCSNGDAFPVRDGRPPSLPEHLRSSGNEHPDARADGTADNRADDSSTDRPWRRVIGVFVALLFGFELPSMSEDGEESLSREELLERAREADIPGRSEMSKEELREALNSQ